MSNYKFKTTKIRGNSYVQVNERIKFFRQESQYKNWCISTDFPMLTADEALCRCTISDRDGVVVAVGHAHEVKTASAVNKTSYVENCETSAVGRALGMLGIGIDDSIASGDEVEMAMAQEQVAKSAPKKAPPKKTKTPAEPAPQAPVEPAPDNIKDLAIEYIKGATDKRKAFDKIMQKYGDQINEAQQTTILKFVN